AHLPVKSVYNHFTAKGSDNDRLPASKYVRGGTINVPFIVGAVLMGVISGIVAAASYMFMYKGANTEFARSCAAIALCFSMASFGILRMNKRAPGGALLRGGVAAFAALGILAIVPILLVYIPGVNTAFGLMAVDVLAMFISVATGIVPAILWYVVSRFVKLK
ncbi:MAG: cation transporting ATPase C-terminal domain-containing protein, partial [Oscillospiraceae bacterium]